MASPSTELGSWASRVLLLLLAVSTNGFHGVSTVTSSSRRGNLVNGSTSYTYQRTTSSTPAVSVTGEPSRFRKQQQQQYPALPTQLHGSPIDDNEDDDSTDSQNRRLRLFHRFVSWPSLRSRWLRRMAVATALVMTTTSLGRRPPTASANAPVMAMPKAEARDPIEEALDMQRRKNAQAAQQELQDVSRKAQQIEAEQGPQARIEFEQAYQQRKEQQVKDKAAGLIALQRELLQKGICPFCDLEGKRVVMEYETGIDLSAVPGTQYQLEQRYEQRNSPKAYRVQKEQHRRIIQCMVEDMTNRGVDPVEYFRGHTDQTQTILNLSPDQAQRLVAQYQANLEQYGQITKPKPGELSMKEQIHKRQTDPAFIKAEKKRMRAEERQQAKEQKAQQKAQAAAEKAEKKAEAASRKAAAKSKSTTTTTTSAAGAVAGGLAGASASSGAAAASGVLDAVTNAMPSTSGGSSSSPSSAVLIDQQKQQQLDTTSQSSGGAFDGQSSSSSGVTSNSGKTSKTPLRNKAIAGAAIVSGSGFVLNTLKKRIDQADADNQRQLRQLMESFGTDDDDDDAGSTILKGFKDDEPLDGGFTDDDEESFDMPTLAEPPQKAKPKKKRLGIFSSKKKNTRETDLMNLVSADGGTSQFSMVLAKLLSFSVPNVFAYVQKLPGGMPMVTYDLEEAKLLLDIEQDNLTEEDDSAEAFASVVNCMLIDVVDVAASMKKDSDIIKALDVVTAFLEHAAALFAVFAADVTMDPPVTYGGSIGKRKLEKIYGAYASQALERMTDEAFMSHMDTLREVLDISELKAQGAMTKSLMGAMKDPKKLEQMAEMMGGEEGMAELMKGMEEVEGMDPSMLDKFDDPEQLLEMLRMLKDMKESGTIGPSEMEKMKTQFKSQFGESIDSVMQKMDSGTEEMTDVERELADLMKSIMDF